MASSEFDRITSIAVCWTDGRWSAHGPGFKSGGQVRGGLHRAHVRAGSEAHKHDRGGFMRAYPFGVLGTDGVDRGVPCA